MLLLASLRDVLLLVARLRYDCRLEFFHAKIFVDATIERRKRPGKQLEKQPGHLDPTKGPKPGNFARSKDPNIFRARGAREATN